MHWVLFDAICKKYSTADVTSREFCQNRMMSTGLEKVDTIDDIQEACELVKSFGLSTKGIDSLNEVKNKLREHLKGLEETSSRKIGEVCNHSNTFSVQISLIFMQNMINYPTICKSKLSEYTLFRLFCCFKANLSIVILA